jgi:uncharacterized protein with HEPN domain
MDERDRRHLLDLIDHAQTAIGYARAHGRGWWKNAETLDAVLMRISQVGESASKTSAEALAEVPHVEWRDIRGIRAKIVHDYKETDVLLIRGVVARQLPRLITAVRRALGIKPGPSAPASRRPRA